MNFKFPENLPTDAEALAALRAEALEAFNEVYQEGQAPTQDELDYMTCLVDGIKSIDTQATDLEAAEERATSAADMAASLAEAAAEKEAADEAEAEVQAKEEASEASDESAGAETQKQNEEVTEAEAVAASGQRTRFSQAAGHTPPELPAQEAGFRLTTSAKNFETGVVDSLRVAQEFGHLAVGQAARVIGAGGRTMTTLAYLDRNAPSEFAIQDEANALTVLDRVTDETRLDGGSLVAAGGWCAPSETMYDFLPVEAPAGLLSLPEVTVRRGGIRVPNEPDFATVYESIGFHQTEAQAQAGTEKTCFEVPCGEFQEVRLDVEGVCITSGILQDKAWPELTKKYVDEALRLHQHKISARRIDTIVKGSTNVGTLTGPMFGTAGAVLSALELQVADMRARHRIPRTRSLEGFAPEWLLSVIKADLAYRDEVLPEQVTDEMVRDHFANVGVNFQFVADWQNDALGKAAPAVAWPTEVKVVLYQAGTWWAATEPVINLGIIHDSTMLKQNKQVQMFTEDGVAVGKRRDDSRLLTIPVAVDGTVGARYQAATDQP